MHYMWDDILRRDSLIELITKFVFIQREQVVDELTGKKSVKEKLIFPRYHQRDAVRQLLADAEYNGTQLNYLIEHSAGSGKTNTIAAGFPARYAEPNRLRQCSGHYRPCCGRPSVAGRNQGYRP